MERAARIRRNLVGLVVIASVAWSGALAVVVGTARPALAAPTPERLGAPLVFSSDRSGRFGIYRIDGDAPGLAVAVTTAGTGAEESRRPSWLASGGVVYDFGAPLAADIYRITSRGTDGNALRVRE